MMAMTRHMDKHSKLHFRPPKILRTALPGDLDPYAGGTASDDTRGTIHKRNRKGVIHVAGDDSLEEELAYYATPTPGPLDPS
jgi:hypothetical protein